MATTNDLKNGMILVLDKQLWSVVEFQHVKPGKGPAFVRTKLRNVMTGKGVDKTFNAGVKVESGTVIGCDMQHLNHNGTDYVFMYTGIYEQISLSGDVIVDAKDFMPEIQDVVVAFHENAALFVELPANVVVTVATTAPGLQGDRSSGGTKPATLETGREIQVPLFVDEGDLVRVNTATGEYKERA